MGSYYTWLKLSMFSCWFFFLLALCCCWQPLAPSISWLYYMLLIIISNFHVSTCFTNFVYFFVLFSIHTWKKKKQKCLKKKKVKIKVWTVKKSNNKNSEKKVLLPFTQFFRLFFFLRFLGLKVYTFHTRTYRKRKITKYWHAIKSLGFQ